MHAAGATGLAGASAHAEGTVTPPAGMTLAQQVDHLRREIERLTAEAKELGRAHGELSDRVGALEARADELAKLVDDLADELGRRIDVTGAGHVALRVFSACGIALGVVYATWAAQIGGTTPGTVMAWVAFVVTMAFGAVALWDARRTSSAQGQGPPAQLRAW